jgi:hypothetical protein
LIKKRPRTRRISFRVLPASGMALSFLIHYRMLVDRNTIKVDT